MPRVIVTTQPYQPSDDAQVLFDEDVYSVHLSTRHAAGQLVERISWAVRDAEEAECARRDQRRSGALRRRAGSHELTAARTAVGA